MNRRILLLCCRSCLRGDGDNHEYYDVLGLPDKHVTLDAIKKAFKKASLNLHPDKLAQRGIEETAESKLMFLKLKEAYDVLSDPKRRRLYDDLGASGLKLVETPSNLVNPLELIKNFQKNRSDRVSIAIVVALIFCCLLILPILFSLKCDGTLGKNAPWVAIWTPMWLVDMMLIISTFLLFMDQQDKVNEDGDVIEHQDTTPMSLKLINMATAILFVLTQVFLFLRLDEYINWNWFAIFSPWLAYEALQVLTIIPAAFASIPLPNLDALSLSTEEEDIGENDFIMKKIGLEIEYFENVFTRETERKSLVGHLIRAWLAVFFALKLNGTVDWNWALVFLPAWVSFFTQYCFAYYFRSWGRRLLDSVDAMDLEAGCEAEKAAKTDQGKQLISAGFTAIVLTFAPAFITILLVCRLQNIAITTFVIIIPIFLALSCCCCFTFCAIIMAATVDTDEIDKNFDGSSMQDRPANGEPTGKGAYEPPLPVPPVSAHTGVHPSDISVTLESGTGASPVAYGTFKSPDNSSESPLVNRTSPRSNSVDADFKEGDDHPLSPAVILTSHLLPVTTIDADID